MSIKSTVYPVILAGKVRELRFDIQALTSAHAALKALNMGRGTIWQLADQPYDLPEEVILLHAGLNGAKRLNKDSDLYTLEDIQNLLQEHLDSMAEDLSQIDNEQDAMKEFQKRQQDLMNTLADAVKGAIGFRYKGKRDKPAKKERVDA